MDEDVRLADRFEEHRNHLEAVAYRMLGSVTEADDAVQGDLASVPQGRGRWRGEPWRIVDDNRRPTVPECAAGMPSAARGAFLGAHVPDPVISGVGRVNPEQEVLLAGAVGLALSVVLDTLEPAERLAFVLHDMVGLPFDEIAPMVGRAHR